MASNALDQLASRRRLLCAAGGAVLAMCGLRTAHAQPRVIQVVARKFVFLPAELKLSAGESVVLEITAPEVVMGYSVPQLGTRVDVVPGQVARLPLNVSKPGTYDVVCDIYCGDGHEGMSGHIVVT
ncbi:MAG TPA: cupredoxin domain-containing protein [Burkholderiaceae bacterium]|jgi:cytochrome c oxidase subunit 2|nr:cupredoxin domain-containing protein [Burkholderiaceae bacterium]